MENKLIGNYQNKIDEKGRMTIPTKLRLDLSDTVVISIGFDNALELRSVEAFEAWSSILQEKGNLSTNARNLSRAILGNSFEVSIDKAGRVLLPKQLTDMVKIEKEVAIVGVGDKLEIHPAEQWAELLSDPKELAKSLQEMAEELSKN